jgi:hypothetical protein
MSEPEEDSKLPTEPKYPIINPSKDHEPIYISAGLARYKGLSPGSKLVYARLRRYAWKKGLAFPKIPTLAEEVGLGERQTQYYLRELRLEHFIFSTREFHQRNLYAFEAHPCLTEGSTEVGESRWNGKQGSVHPNEEHTQDAAYAQNEKHTQDAAYAHTQDAACAGGPHHYSLNGVIGMKSIKSPKPSFQTPSELPDEDLKPVDVAHRIQRGSQGTKAKMTGSDRKKLVMFLEGKDLREAMAAAELFLADDYWREKKFPAAAFMSQYRKYVDRMDNGPTTPPPPAPAANHPEAPAIAPRANSASAKSIVASYADRWNALVPENPVNWNSDMEGNLGVDAVSNQLFENSFDTACQKAKRRITADSEAKDWLSFRWILKQKGESWNWYRLAQGAYDFVPGKQSNGSPAAGHMPKTPSDEECKQSLLKAQESVRMQREEAKAKRKAEEESRKQNA